MSSFAVIDDFKRKNNGDKRVGPNSVQVTFIRMRTISTVLKLLDGYLFANLPEALSQKWSPYRGILFLSFVRS